MTNLMGGQIDTMCDQTTNTMSQIKGGDIKAYAVTTRARIAALPEVPTLAESGFKDFNPSNWWMLSAPKGTAESVVNLLHKTVADYVEAGEGGR